MEGGWSTPRPGRFTPGKNPVPIVQEAGWAPGPVWMGAENLTSTGIQSLDHPAHSESLYRLSYPSPCKMRSTYYFIISKMEWGRGLPHNNVKCMCVLCVCMCVYIQGVTGGTDQTLGECSLGQTIPI